MLTKSLPGLIVELPRHGSQDYSLKHVGIVDLKLLPDSPALRYSQGQPCETSSAPVLYILETEVILPA